VSPLTVSARPEATPGRSLWAEAWLRMGSNRAALISAVLLAVIALASLAAPWISPHDFDALDFDRVAIAPDWESRHFFGTDAVGRDLLARTLQGGRISLLVGLAATAVSALIGVGYGAVAGYAGGRLDSLLMRIVDVLYALPFMFLVILLMVIFGRQLILIFVAIGAVEWLNMARIVRGQTLSLESEEFVQAARACGASPAAIVRRHIVPNTLGPVIVYMTLTVPQVILFESFLSFLGLGVQEPDTSWGVLIAEGARQMESAPWALIFPASFLAATLFCLNFLGDGLRDALDPRYR
jgi:oligopeptide transport system permease protein